MDNITTALAALASFEPHIAAAVQVFNGVSAVVGTIKQASAEGRDLSDAEVAAIKERLATTEAEWKALAPPI